MSWTEERTEALMKLWSAGLSASQISKALGGVSRNAVIGKVHRLGLAGRATPSKPEHRTYVAPRPRKRASPQRPPAIVRHPPEPAAAPIDSADAPAGLATVLTLGAHMCKWPIGDPAREGFTFCGKRKSEGSYCVEHARIAFQPAQNGKKRNASELARSLRRYL